MASTMTSTMTSAMTPTVTWTMTSTMTSTRTSTMTSAMTPYSNCHSKNLWHLVLQHTAYTPSIAQGAAACNKHTNTTDQCLLQTITAYHTAFGSPVAWPLHISPSSSLLLVFWFLFYFWSPLHFCLFGPLLVGRPCGWGPPSTWIFKNSKIITKSSQRQNLTPKTH